MFSASRTTVAACRRIARTIRRCFPILLCACVAVARAQSITTSAGNAAAGFAGDAGPATSAALNQPRGLAFDAAGNLYIADYHNHRVRRVSTAGVVTTVAGTSALAGSDQGSFSGDGGPAEAAGLNTPEDVVVDSAGFLFIANSANNRIRKVSPGNGLDGFAGDGGPALDAQLNLPWALALNQAGHLVFSDMFNNRVREVSPAAASALPIPGIPMAAVGPPIFPPNGLVNGANFRVANSAGGSVAPGAIVSLFGQDLADHALLAASTPLPTTMGGTTVTIGGFAAPLFYVSPTQINFQVPFAAPAGPLVVQVTRDSVISPPQTVLLSTFSPGIFTVPPGGSGLGAILHADNFAPVNEAAPARRGEFISLFATGLGPVQPPVAAGAAAPSAPASNTTITPLVTIGGVPAQVTFSGLAPGFAGLYQVNAQIPAGVQSGAAMPLSLSISGVAANTVTLPIQ